jgi:hypothetical protein
MERYIGLGLNFDWTASPRTASTDFLLSLLMNGVFV